jgi:hypothetical protein
MDNGELANTTNTGEIQEKPRKPGTFVKGDPRINKNGRPKSFDELRELAKQLANETIEDKKTGLKYTIVEAILKRMASDPKMMKDFLEIAYGKVPTVIDVEGNVNLSFTQNLKDI